LGDRGLGGADGRSDNPLLIGFIESRFQHSYGRFARRG
jgi:hypothetical protein